ncbi:DNA-binding protein [Rhodococcus sp. ACPA4]|uniref:Excisionase family DNA binding protein n=2 Tax=Nocardiaceae TaxID=85025 RepID=A0A652YJL6_NOCGL|nr:MULTISPECIES: helix-turn-helix domain-containing protein [Rhodococcus]NMD64011.1 helix-turn-helix domain-containing protein [Nocardia globerula]NRI67789.1 helix-turn-helix domain-containing protein [Rhodococcus sp. MS16]MDV6269845.1 helix-turn-helix domain-containing protein [Rhodococcus globerulus]PBC38129.1 DNA-binding protein [Rhodococcus sp. ACPA4]PVX66725.1 excisionase family DNA binding protein [Rhodococcus globerulus]
MSIDHVISAVGSADAEKIKTALSALAQTSTATTTLVIDGVTIDVPASVGDAVVALLKYLANGDSVALGAVAELLTTSQAAEILGVSDTYVRKLADAGKLPIELRGTHRRFRLDDVMAYREQFPKRS